MFRMIHYLVGNIHRLLKMTYIFSLKVSKTFLREQAALSAFEAWSFLVLTAVVPCSSNLATYRWMYVARMQEPTGYCMLAVKQMCKKLDTASSSVSIPLMIGSFSTVRSKYTFLKQNNNG